MNLPHRTDVTGMLWKHRHYQNQKLNPQHNTGRNSSHMPVQHNTEAKPPKEFSLRIPFGSDLDLRDQYQDPLGGVMYGKCLEDLDSFAGNVAFFHVDDQNPDTLPLKIVTVAVDQIYLKKQIPVDKDVEMWGKCVHVGSSSLRIDVGVREVDELEATNQDKDSASRDLLTSSFYMVALNPKTGKPANINQLLLKKEEDQRAFDEAEDRKKLKREHQKQNLFLKDSPTDAEKVLLHDIFLRNQKRENAKHSRNPADDEDQYVRMKDTSLKSISFMKRTKRNPSGSIFGGFLMNTAYELAFMCASNYCPGDITFAALNETVFKKPVPVGSFLRLSSKVVYSSTKQKQLYIEVLASTQDPQSTDPPQLTNVFQFVFKVPNVPRKVQPETYVECMKFLEARRMRKLGL